MGSYPLHPGTQATDDLDWKGNVRLATIAALPANTRTNNTLDADANGALPTVDSVAPAVSDRLLIKDEATGANRGIFRVSSLGGAGSKWKLIRTDDADASGEVTAGMAMIVTEGTTFANLRFVLTTNDPITLNTTALTFALTNATPTPHAGTHENGGSDEISVLGLSGLLADDQNPVTHASEHTDGTDDIQNATAAQKGLATATQITKLDGIETAATADQTDAEIKTAYENNANTNEFSDAEQTKLAGIETLADVTDATNVEAAGAVLESDTTTAAMGFVIDEDDMSSDLDTKVPTQQSVKKFVEDSTGAMLSEDFALANTFVVNDVVRISGTGHVKAQADTAANAEAVGIITARPDASNYTVTYHGALTGLTGITADSTMFLSASTAGLLTATAPSAAGEIVKPIMFGHTTTSGVMTNFIGTTIAVSDAVVEADFNANTILAANADDTPLALTVAEQTIVGRITAGNIDALTVTEVRTLINVEDDSTADQTDAEIKTAYENNADTNEFSDAEQTKLAGVETAATADQTDVEIETAYNNQVAVVSQVDAEAGTSTTRQGWTAQRVKQAIDALVFSGGTVTTTDATVTTLELIAIPDDTVVIIEVFISARRTDAEDGASYIRRASVFREAAGSATIRGTVDTTFTRESSAPWNATITVSGNNALISVTGQAANTINWKSSTKAVQVG